MHRSLLLCLLTTAAVAQPRPGPAPKPAFFAPGISPGGAEIAFEEIAETLAISPNTAASRYRYGLDKLRARLRPLYDEIR